MERMTYSGSIAFERDFIMRSWLCSVLTKVMRKPSPTSFFANWKHGVIWPWAGYDADYRRWSSMQDLFSSGGSHQESGRRVKDSRKCFSRVTSLLDFSDHSRLAASKEVTSGLWTVDTETSLSNSLEAIRVRLFLTNKSGVLIGV